MSRGFPRLDPQSGWRHVDIRVNRDGAIEILTSFTLAPLGSIEALKDVPRRHREIAAAIIAAQKYETFLEDQEGTKKVSK